VIVALAAVVRLLAARGDLWLDEIFTVALAEIASSPLAILTELPHENNHVLNTFFVYLLRPLDWDWLYRLPACIAGVAAVAVGAWVAWLGDGRGEGAPDDPARVRSILAALLLGGSYLSIHYGTEARGYAFALCFGFVALGVALRDGVTAWSRRAPLYWLALLLAVLGQALAVHWFAALVAWSTLHVARARRGWSTTVMTLAWWHGVPALACAAFYLGFLRVMKGVGGPQEGALAPLERAIALATGLPVSGADLTYVAGALGILAAGIWWLVRRGSDLWVLYAVGIAGSPAALWLLKPTDLYFERYFVVSAALWLLLAARLLASLATRGRAAIACATILVAFVIGNAVRLEQLLRDQRGHYRAALRYIADRTAGDAITVASDQDFRNGILVAYFAPRLGIAKRIRYVARGELSLTGTDWYIVHRLTDGDVPPAIVSDAWRNRYRLAAHFAATRPSGFHWYVYQRLGAAGG